MKNLLTLLLLFLITFSYAQDRFGEFIIGKTNIDIISNIEKDIGKLQITNDLTFYNNSIENIKPKFCEILLNNNCEIRVFYVSKYRIDELELNDIYLFFHENILIQFICNKSEEIDDYFTKKYGKPFKFEKYSQDIRSSTMKYDQLIVELLWKKNNIKTISYQNFQYFGKIPRNAGSYFIISDTLKQKIIIECDNFKE